VRTLTRRDLGAVGLAAGLFLSPLVAAAAAAAAQEVPQAKVGQPAPEVVFTDIDGKERRLSALRGRPVMLWLIATWCPTCQASAKILAARARELETGGLVVVTLRLYNNLGYEGPEIRDFAARWAPSLLDRAGWLWGDADLETSLAYDVQGYPDIYWLIDANGILRHVDTAPNVTFDRIAAFAAGS